MQYAKKRTAYAKDIPTESLWADSDREQTAIFAFPSVLIMV